MMRVVVIGMDCGFKKGRLYNCSYQTIYYAVRVLGRRTHLSWVRQKSRKVAPESVRCAANKLGSCLVWKHVFEQI